jgi:hypothetical protein
MERTGIFSISIPSPVSEITRAELRGLKHLQRAGGGGDPQLVPYNFPPTRVWLEGTQEVEGIEVETMLHICWWTREEREKHFKEYLCPGETQTRLDKFLEYVRSAGAVYIIEEHCDFRRIYIHD